MSDEPTIFIGVCNTQSMVPAAFFWSFTAMAKPYRYLVARGGHPWDVVRNNQLIDKFLKSDADIFVKMDIDQSYPLDYLEQMVPLVEQYKVIGPVIYDRWEHNGFMPLAFDEYEPRFIKCPLEGKNRIVDIRYTHTNLFYAREVFEKVKNPIYRADLSDDGLNRANHVDYCVLDKIRAAGYPVYTNLDVVVKHLAEVPVDESVHERWNR